MSNYNGKDIFIGVDVHKNTYTFVALHEKEVVKKATIEAKPELLVKFAKEHFVGANIFMAYEAGFSGFHLHRQLTNNGLNNIVVHPASIEVSSRDRVKTDKRDAMKIAVQLQAGRLKSVMIPDEKREGFRSITRLRAKFGEHKKRMGNQIKSLLHQHGVIGANDNRKICKTWLEWIMTLKLNEDVMYSLQFMKEQWINLDNKINEIEKKLAEQSTKDVGLDMIYSSFPGVGLYTSRIIANELGDMSQFSNQKKLFSFTGLTPCEYSSGDNIRQGHISRQGRPILRKILIQAAWTAVKVDEIFKKKYEELGNRIGKKKAIVAVARNMVGIMRSCIKSGSMYNAA
jgi:transposase